MQNAMIKGKKIWGILFLMAISFSCKETFDPYERPDWLAGKVYSQIREVDNLKTFTTCLEITGYDKVIDASGSYTVFAPSDEAFQQYFSTHPKYKKVEDFPKEELLDLVKYHIVQNPWSRDQLRSLDVNGWIDPEDENNDKPRGFKRETLLMKKDYKFGVKVLKDDIDELVIVDTTASNWHLRVATDSRKYAPIFYSEYFNIYNLKLSDYTFYFDRSFESVDDLFYVNAKIVGDEIFAENGFVYTIDQVVEPLQNAYEILTDKSNPYNYSKFLDLVNQFPVFNYNQEKTFRQPGAEQGLEVDSLFDLTYPELAFAITSEKTKAPASGSGLPEEVSIRFHHGLLAPTNEAFDAFVQQYIVGNNQWGSFDVMPPKIKRIVANTYFSPYPIYETDIIEGFYNGEDDIVRISTGDILQKEYGSNVTFLGVNKAIVPRAFKSITGPVFRQRGYSTMMNAIEFSGLLSALKREGQGNMLFAVADSKLAMDSSLIYTYVKVNNIESESFKAEMLHPTLKTYPLSVNDIRLLLLNQVAVESPLGQARREFLKTLAGNHLIWDNEAGTVRGTAPSSFGYQGTTQVTLKPTQISTDTDNGTTHAVDAWFRFSTNTIYAYLSANFPAFHALLQKAKLSLDKEARYSFVSDNKIYTIFAPSDEALQAIQADTLTGKNLENFVKLHFISDEMIFTDGRKTDGYYKTNCQLTVSGTSRNYNVEIYIEPGVDQIVIKNKNGGTYAIIEESESTNMITARNLNVNEETNFPNTMSTSVVHKLDKAFLLNELDIK
jgi:uncharacterized surface protein with fasciclin (FAS1) repeats